MSAPLVVSIPHKLGREEAMRRLKTGLSRAASSVPMLSVDEERWEDNRMIFRVRALGQAAAGNVDVAEDHVRVEVVLRNSKQVRRLIGSSRGNPTGMPDQDFDFRGAAALQRKHAQSSERHDSA